MAKLSTMDVVKALHQAAHDGQHGKGNQADTEQSIGLRREKFELGKEQQFMDGFGIGITGKILKISYNTQAHMNELNEGSFDRKMEGVFDQILKYLRKEFKTHTGKALRLKQKGETDIMVLQRVFPRSYVKVCKYFEIKNIKDV